MEAEKFTEYLLSRFGIPLPQWVKLEGENSIRAMSKELHEFKTTTPKGIPASKMKGIFPKPSTAFLQLFGNLATKNTIEVSRADANSFMEGKTIHSDAQAETGYVILRHKGAVLGCGFYREGEIESLIPKQIRIRKKE